MKVIHLLPVGDVDLSLLPVLSRALRNSFSVACETLPFTLDPNPFYHPERQQFHSSQILQHMQTLVRPGDWRWLAITDVDLYIPILKYVFGEAQIGGPCAVVSTYRLRQEFYGLGNDPALLAQRVAKECIHEAGHTFGLTHCQDYRCAMASAHAVEWIDLREGGLCEDCRSRISSVSLQTY